MGFRERLHHREHLLVRLLFRWFVVPEPVARLDGPCSLLQMAVDIAARHHSEPEIPALLAFIEAIHEGVKLLDGEIPELLARQSEPVS